MLPLNSLHVGSRMDRHACFLKHPYHHHHNHLGLSRGFCVFPFCGLLEPAGAFQGSPWCLPTCPFVLRNGDCPLVLVIGRIAGSAAVLQRQAPTLCDRPLNVRWQRSPTVAPRPCSLAPRTKKVNLLWRKPARPHCPAQ